MKKTEVTIKEMITLPEKVNMINEIVAGYFTQDDNGAVYYTPYFKDMYYLITFFKYAVTGIEFEEGEDIYKAVVSDRQLMQIYERWYSHTYAKHLTELTKQIDEVISYVEDMVDFRKKLLLKESGLVEQKLLQLINTEIENKQMEQNTIARMDSWMEKQEKLVEYNIKCAELLPPEKTAEILEGMTKVNFDTEKIGEIIAREYFGSNEHGEKLKELFDAKQEEIRRLKEGADNDTIGN